MKTSDPKTRQLLMRAVEIEQLPALVPRSVAARFACLSPRTLARAEKQGLLRPVKRNLASVSYDRSEFLRFLGIEPAAPIRTKKAN